jgi:hypothetical protein
MSLAEFAGRERLDVAMHAALITSVLQSRYPLSHFLLGAGLVTDGNKFQPANSSDLYPMVVVSQELSGFDANIYLLGQVRDALGMVIDALGTEPSWLLQARAVVIPSPEAHASAGGSISSPNVGSVGCQASWTGGNGFLTAGHVAPTVNQNVFDGRTQLGTVRFANNPANGGTAATADVSVVELSSGLSFSPMLGKAVAAGPNAGVTVKNSGSQKGTIMGFCSFLYWPKVNGTYGDTYLTTSAISTGGDSGCAVVDGNGDVVGMIVGGASKMTTFIQDVRYQRNHAGSSLANLTI